MREIRSIRVAPWTILSAAQWSSVALVVAAARVDQSDDEAESSESSSVFASQVSRTDFVSLYWRVIAW
jgi:hypothetical protein